MTGATGAALRVAMIGHSFMGTAHSRAWRDVNAVYRFPVRLDRALLCGRDLARATKAATQLGWEQASADWRDAVGREDIDIVDICTPVSSHAAIALAALAAGKHVICEKPLALDTRQSRQLADAAAAAAERGQLAMCGFNYRRVPAVALMRELVRAGRIGAPRQLHASYLQDWGVLDPSMSWRFRAAEAGFGALGDLGSHLVDLAEHVTGSLIESVAGTASTFIGQRQDAAGGRYQVDVDDAVAFIARLDGGAIATFEASRVALGAKNSLTLEVFGDRGSLRFNLETLNELHYFDAADDSRTAGYRRILVTEPDHPYLRAWWPPGHVLGWEHSFTHELHDFVSAIVLENPIEPDFSQADHVQQVLQAVAVSAASRRWHDVPR